MAADNEGLPPGFVPAWTFIKTEDGVVEYEHPAGALVVQFVTCPECGTSVAAKWTPDGVEEVAGCAQHN